MRFPKILVGLVLMVLVTSITYTLVIYPQGLRQPCFLLILGFTSLFSLLIVLPLMAVLAWRDWSSLTTFMLLLALVTFAIFFSWNLISYGSAIKYVQGGRVLVVDGAITADGYAKSVVDSMITVLITAPGGFLLWFSTFGTRQSPESGDAP